MSKLCLSFVNQVKYVHFGDVKVEDLIFLDETGVNLAMVSLYARGVIRSALATYSMI